MTWLVEIITSRCMDPPVQAKLKWICDVLCFEKKWGLNRDDVLAEWRSFDACVVLYINYLDGGYYSPLLLSNY
jgi:hypothetical protein